jgi:hypothetical protein
MTPNNLRTWALCRLLDITGLASKGPVQEASKKLPNHYCCRALFYRFDNDGSSQSRDRKLRSNVAHRTGLHPAAEVNR